MNRKFTTAEAVERFGYDEGMPEGEQPRACIHGNPEDDCFECKIENVPFDIELLRCDVCGETRVYKGHCYVCDKNIA